MGLFGPPNIDKMKSKCDIKGLVKALEYEKEVSIRKSAAEALSEIFGSDKASLVAVLKDNAGTMRESASRAIMYYNLADHLIASLHDGHISLSERQAAAEALVYLYKSGLLDAAQERDILGSRNHITTKHEDLTKHYDRTQSSDCHADNNTHTDKGIGVRFHV